MQFRILFQDEWLVAIDKPAGFQVHQPEDKKHRVSRSFDCVHQLHRQLDRYIYPVHRLDRATSGVLLFALDSDTARNISERFQMQQTRKTYFCVTRGWVAEEGRIDDPLSSEVPGAEKKEALTCYQRIARIELPHAVGRYPSARYSLVRVEPRSGRMHQIRRHFVHISHPLIGDTMYGDGQHNRFFRTQFDMRGLFLKAYSLELTHPATGEPLRIRSKWNPVWHKVFELFGTCPVG